MSSTSPSSSSWPTLSEAAQQPRSMGRGKRREVTHSTQTSASDETGRSRINALVEESKDQTRTIKEQKTIIQQLDTEVAHLRAIVAQLQPENSPLMASMMGGLDLSIFVPAKEIPKDTARPVLSDLQELLKEATPIAARWTTLSEKIVALHNKAKTSLTASQAKENPLSPETVKENLSAYQSKFQKYNTAFLNMSPVLPNLKGELEKAIKTPSDVPQDYVTILSRINEQPMGQSATNTEKYQRAQTNCKDLLGTVNTTIAGIVEEFKAAAVVLNTLDNNTGLLAWWNGKQSRFTFNEAVAVKPVKKEEAKPSTQVTKVEETEEVVEGPATEKATLARVVGTIAPEDIDSSLQAPQTEAKAV